MKARFYIILLVLCALFDDFISLFIPADFQYQGILIVPHFCLCAMLAIVCSRNWLDRILIGALVGLLTDYFFTISFPTYFLLYALLGFASGLLYKYIEDNSIFQALYLWFLTIFVDLIPFVFYKATGQLNVALGTWLLHGETVTMIVSALAICMMVYVVHVYERYETIQSIRQKKVEKRKLHNLKLSRK